MTTTAAEFRSPADADIPAGHPDDPDTPPPGVRTDDPEAPYGYRTDGTPRAKPGRRTGTPNTSPRRPAPPRQRTAPAGGSKPRKKGPAVPDYRGGILGMVQLAAAPLLVVGAKNDAALADAAALTMHGEPIADALHNLAVDRPEVAAVLERVLTAGPYGVVLAAALPLAVQLAANHGLIPPQIAQALGGEDPKVLVHQMRGTAPEPSAMAPAA